MQYICKTLLPHLRIYLWFQYIQRSFSYPNSWVQYLRTTVIGRLLTTLMLNEYFICTFWRMLGYSYLVEEWVVSSIGHLGNFSRQFQASPSRQAFGALVLVHILAASLKLGKCALYLCPTSQAFIVASQFLGKVYSLIKHQRNWKQHLAASHFQGEES
jgi:hypothetical protein